MSERLLDSHRLATTGSAQPARVKMTSCHVTLQAGALRLVVRPDAKHPRSLDLLLGRTHAMWVISFIVKLATAPSVAAM